ncbi:RNA recognition motif (RRM, RBD, or RNP domain) [Novymonas esmeraldas]|uniref:RNA recognition motif (RRM, RBD, or RNP domain) n=1 Tax=Novymonas esmeraldas TaxID=1808958 RepID=A0AAW0EM07_9TRYP
MSRVRILNLPNNCTEAQLKDHLLRTAPREAPLLEITDVQLIRRPATAKDRRYHQRQSHGGAATPRMILRMAFVGFRTSAAGHFVVSYFHSSFFHGARLTVELAKGLADVGTTVNQLRKKQKQEEQQKSLTMKDAGTAATGPTSSSSSSAVAGQPSVQSTSRKRVRGDGDDTADSPAVVDEGLARRQREFVEQRRKATEGPTWAAEVLVAPTTAQGSTATEVEEASRDAQSPAQARQRKRASARSATAVVNDDGGEDDDEAARERQALSRQQALGEVSDIDFLAGLGGGGAPSTPPPPHRATDATAAAAATQQQQQEQREDSEDEDDAEAEAPTVRDTKKAAKRGTKVRDDGGAATAAQAAAAAAVEKEEETARVSHRVRLGNVPYVATEEHLKQFAASLVGPVEAVHIPLTKDTRQNKGAAFIRFATGEDAVRALQLCRGAILMGRLLRVSAAEEDPHGKRVMEREAALASTAAAQGGDGATHGTSLAGSSQFKKQREVERRAGGGSGGGEAGNAQVTWNTMYMNSHAAVETVAQRLGVRSEDVVGVGAKGAAVRAAIAEAYLTSEVQQVLSDEGIAFDLLEGATQNLLKARSNTTILVKNLQLKDGNDAAELTRLFVRFGALETSAFPSAGSFALFRYTHPQDARIAFTRLSYKLFKTAPLFLEWAPVGALVEDGEGGHDATTAAADLGLAAAEQQQQQQSQQSADGGAVAAVAANTMVYTLFLTNISFQTTEDELHAFVLDACPRLARAPETLLKRLVLQQQQGRAFLTVADQSTLTYCVAKMNGKSLAGRTVSCVVSNQTAQLQQQQRQARAVDGGGGATPQGSAAGGALGHGDDDDDEDDATKTAVIARRRGAGAGSTDNAAGAAPSRVPPGGDPLKIIVKNLPFEATEKDVRELFAAFSEVRTVRLPRKSNTFTSHRENNHRGFAFVEFLSETEAARALEALKATHLYGRHLVLQYAKLDG